MMKETGVMSTPGSEGARDLTREGQAHGHGRTEAADHPAMQQAFLDAANARLNIQSKDATKLLGDQILGLASIMQAGANDGSNDVGWMHSPSPYNYWHTFFMRTLTNPAYHGTVHIMAVNSDSQHSLHVTTAGTHWFLQSSRGDCAASPS